MNGKNNEYTVHLIQSYYLSPLEAMVKEQMNLLSWYDCH